MFYVVCVLYLTTTICFIDRVGHSNGLFTVMRVHHDTTICVTCCTSDNLKKGSLGSEKSYFFSIQYSDEACFGEVEPFSKKIYSYNHIDFTETVIPQYLKSFNRFDFRVKISYLDSIFCKICCEVF